jgi:diaminopimelate decarboxylase
LWYQFCPMNMFTYKSDELFAENVAVRSLAEQYGTPLYVYSKSHLRDHFAALQQAMSQVSPLICYSVKANSNRAVIGTFVEQGAGLDIVSGGELFRALQAGASPSKIVFAGVGKTREEIEYALKEQILFFTVESEPEAQRISQCAQALGVTGRVAFRVNPDVDPKTHKYVTTGKKENKFGLDFERTGAASKLVLDLPNIELVGLHMHIGSQILTPEPFAEALGKVTALCRELQKEHKAFQYLDIGGGIGIQYQPDQSPLAMTRYADAVVPGLKDLGLSVVMEPGRCLVGNAGILVCQVQYVKDNPFKKFIVVNAGMNDLIRPSLYQAHHEIMPVAATDERVTGDLVGPICESGDFLAQNRELPAADQDDLLAVASAGAYGFTMASNYNSRPRPAEVMVDGDQSQIIRKRETWEDLVAGEDV